MAGERRPVRGLVAAADVTLEVEAPRLRAAAGIAQRAEGNRELRAPAELAAQRLHLPGRIPVEVVAAAGTRLLERAVGCLLPLAGQLAVVLERVRVGGEDEPVLAVVISVEDHLEAVAVVEWRVAAALRDHDALRLAIVADDADVKRVGCVEDADLGLLGRRTAFLWRCLPEIGEYWRDGPGRVVEDVAVDRRRRLGAHRPGYRPFNGRGCRPRRRRDRRLQGSDGGQRQCGVREGRHAGGRAL